MAAELTVGETVIELSRGDLTAWRGDAIVNAANTELVMGAGVAGAIAARAGATVQQEALEQAPIALGEVARTRAGLLPAKFVLHAAVMAADRRTDGDVIARATRAALAEAESIGLRSIAFPALGTGVGRIPYGDAAAAMLGAVVAYLKERTAPRLWRVGVVLYDGDALAAFCEVLDSFATKV